MSDYIIVLLLAFTAVLCAWTLHKVRLIHLLAHQLRDQADNAPATLFRQLEALDGLQRELKLDKSLPRTRGWAGSPDFLLELARHAQTARPQVVLECSSGASTVVLARCMQLQGAGQVYSLEHDPEYAARTRAELARHGLSGWAQVIDAPLRAHQLQGETWPWYSTDHLPHGLPVDMLVIDGPPQAAGTQSRYPAGPLLFPRLTPGAAVYLDDAARADEQAILRRWRSEFPLLRQSLLACEKGCARLVKETVHDDAPPEPRQRQTILAQMH
ncbi:class I SAM-dependent methyltransferase [Janthinobacterium sp. PC23-8]|uniref:class I SAM-dependent methyltransferase n=1 Tax=Janthinobacterium sp. PC23-8 TaxID=2012679 RepID=UPI000B95DC13|nr:class I SAM-dependent methyltransferase [Janthinobacterium sp. PC23-8]OYO28702.1 hypothetical protein CD932_16205 [Janthinobacterium sp. PC23-8]